MSFECACAAAGERFEACKVVNEPPRSVGLCLMQVMYIMMRRNTPAKHAANARVHSTAAAVDKRHIENIHTHTHAWTDPSADPGDVVASLAYVATPDPTSTPSHID